MITNCLNENTNAEMTVMTVRTMFKRAKAKSAQVSNSVNVHHISRVDIPLPRSFAHYVRSFDCGERCGLVDGDLFDLLRGLNVQKPRDRITGLRYSNSSQIPARTRRSNPILAGLASHVTTSLIPFNDIKIISAP